MKTAKRISTHGLYFCLKDIARIIDKTYGDNQIYYEKILTKDLKSSDH